MLRLPVDWWLTSAQAGSAYAVVVAVSVLAVWVAVFGVKVMRRALRVSESVPVVDPRPIPYAIGQFNGSRPRSAGWSAVPVSPSGLHLSEVVAVAATVWALSEVVSDSSSAMDCGSLGDSNIPY
jgi:hypothetical protein